MKYSELIQRMLKLNDKLEEQYGEIMTEDDMEILDIDQSLENWAGYLMQLAREDAANAKATKEMAEYYLARSKSYERKADYRKQGIYALVEMAGKPIKTVAGNARIQQGVESVLVNCPPELLPEEYRKVSYSADKAAIKRDLEAGKELNYAVIERGKPFLVIR